MLRACINLNSNNHRPTAPIWFPGKGAKGKNPAHPGSFYSTKLRAKLAWWHHPSNNCPKRLLQLLQHGVKVNFIDKSTFNPPPRPPKFIDPRDTLFAIQALQDGRKIGAYTDLAAGGHQYLSRSRVSTPLHGKRRLVHALCPLNTATVKRPTCYETLKSLPNILKPNDFMVSLDVESVFFHVVIAESNRKYFSSHFAIQPESRVHSATTRRILVLHQPTPASNTIRIDKTAPSPLLLSSYRVVTLLPAAGLDFKSEDLGRGHQCSQLCSKAYWHSHAFVRRRPACLLWHRSRSLPSPRNHRQDARRCRDYKISDERPVDAFPSSSRSLGPPHRLQGSRQPATARKTLCHDSKSGTSSSLPGLAKPTPHLLKRFATIHRASRQRPLSHSACSLSPPQHLQLPRAIPPALVFNTAGDRRPCLLATHVHITPRQPANPLAPTSHYSFDNRRFRQYRLRQHPGSALRGPPRVRRLLDAMGTTTDHRPQRAQGGTTWASREPAPHQGSAHPPISGQHERSGMFDKIQLSQQALNGRAVPLSPMASTAQHLPRSALYSVRAQHSRPSLSSSQCRPLEPQATHAKFPTATSSTSSGSSSRHRPICLPPICGGSTLLHSSARSPLSRLQWPPPRLVNTTK